MSFELKKPYSLEERASFVMEYNNRRGLRIEDTEMYLFALEPNEIMGTKEIEIEVPDEEGEEQTETITIPYPVINPDYEEEQAEIREAAFNKAFFLTSLGYVRRSVKMADGSHKDFLSDLLPVISMGVQSGAPVNIFTYDKPPFDHDIEDWTEYQHTVLVTAQFIQECFLQLSADFAPINGED